MDIIDRLKQFISHTGMSSSRFADFAGIPRPTLSQLIHGRNKTINDQLLRKLDDAFPDLDIRWLLCGKGEMLSSPNIEISGPQNSLFVQQQERYSPDSMDNAELYARQDKVSNETSNKNTDNGIEDNPSYIESIPSSTSPCDTSPSSATATTDDLTTYSHKKIESIIVFYSDKSFATFYPEH